MTPQRVKQLAAELKRQFKAKVDYEKVGPGGRYRLGLVSKEFEKMTHLKRQDAIWIVVDEFLPRELTLDISMILAYAPSDFQVTKPKIAKRGVKV